MAEETKRKKDVLRDIKKKAPLMDVRYFKAQFLEWLSEMKFPGYASADSWEECLKVFPPEAGEDKKESGLRLRMALRLYTVNYQYLISVMESLDVDSRGSYIMTVHVNWKKEEKRQQKKLEENYIGHFDDSLRARHVIWAQTFRKEEFVEGLNSCARAILANELIPETEYEKKGESILKIQSIHPNFPSEDDILE